jgi:hypothetical protein
MVTIKPSDVQYNKDMMKRFETLAGLNLTKEYLDFLVKYNGGISESNIVELNHDEIQSFSITTFFGLGIDENNDIVKQFNLLNKRVPQGCLPIARVEGGKIICINLNSEKNGHIFLWNHETELLYKDDMTIDKLLPVANSFTEFLDKVKPYNPDEQGLSEYNVQEVWIDPDFLKEIE